MKKLQIAGLSRCAPNEPGKVILEKIELAVAAGDFLWILGASGAGKTSLLRAVDGLDPADAGRIELDGEPFTEKGAAQYRSRVFYLHQAPPRYDGTVESFFQKFFRIKRQGKKAVFETSLMEAMMREAHLGRELLTTPLHKVSGGELMRLSLVRSLLCDPELLLLDEPYAGLDPQSRAAVNDMLRKWQHQGERAILCVSDDFAELKREGDRFLLMAQGGIQEELRDGAAALERLKSLETRKD
jgi:ABC-type multidrug transport system ATPase subunit